MLATGTETFNLSFKMTVVLNWKPAIWNLLILHHLNHTGTSWFFILLARCIPLNVTWTHLLFCSIVENVMRDRDILVFLFKHIFSALLPLEKFLWTWEYSSYRRWNSQRNSQLTWNGRRWWDYRCEHWRDKYVQWCWGYKLVRKSRPRL